MKCVKQFLKDAGSDVLCLCDKCKEEHGEKYGIEFPELLINASKGEQDEHRTEEE